MRMRYLLIFCLFFSGCSIPLSITMKESKTLIAETPESRERDIILQSFNDSGIILKSFEKLGCSMFDMAAFLNEYKKTDIDGFCDFLAEKFPFTQWFRWELDNKIFNPAKRNYNLLKRINAKNK